MNYKNNLLELTNEYNREVFNCAKGGGQSCKNARNLYVEIDIIYNNAFPYMLMQAKKYAKKKKLEINRNVGMIPSTKKRPYPVYKKRKNLPVFKNYNKRVVYRKGKIIRGIIIQPIKNQPSITPSYQGIYNAVNRISFSSNNMETNKITRFI